MPDDHAGLTRRTFVGRAAAGALALLGGCASAPVRAPSAASAPSRLPRPGTGRVLVPSHLWVYASTQPGYDATPVLDQVFADMKYAGLDGVEVMEQVLRHDDAEERIGALIAKHGLPVTGSSYGAPLYDRARHAEILADAQRVIGRLAALGGRTFGVTANRAKTKKTPGQLDAQADAMRRLIDLCEAKEIQLNVHNHTWEVEHDLYEVNGMVERIPGLRLGPDLNWLQRAGVDPVRFIDTFGDRIVYVHIRDQDAAGRWSEAVGEGSMDYAAIAAALRRNHFAGWAAVELAFESGFHSTRPIRESLKQSRAFVRTALGV